MKESYGKEDNDNKKILYNSFNQDHKCFVVGTKDGCRIYHSEPFKKGFKLGNKLYIIILRIIIFKMLQYRLRR